MSIERNYYVIGGYDLTSYKTDKYGDWSWTGQGEEYLCNQSSGKIQLFDDPMGDSYLYLGYIFASGDEYDFPTAVFDISGIEEHRKKVEAALLELVNASVIYPKALVEPKFEIIAFEEDR